MRKISSFAITPVFLLTACIDPNAPPRYLEVAPPTWTNQLEMNVGKRFCKITNLNSGQEFSVSSSGTNIGNGLMADRWRRACSVTDPQRVTCTWGTIENLRHCRTINPDYKRYRAEIIADRAKHIAMPR